jgi:uncharacterized protein (TIGR03437 family)
MWLLSRRVLSLLFLSATCGWSQSVVTTVAGNGTAAFSGDNGQATQASIGRVDSVATDSAGNLYFQDEMNHRVRKVGHTTGVITTIAGTGAAGFSGDNGPAISAQLNAPTGVCTDSSDNVYVNDLSNRRVRKITPQGAITTVAGNGTNADTGDGGLATAASFVLPIRCVVDRSGNLFIADQGAFRVRKVDAATGKISTVAGIGTQGFSGDGGAATSAQLNNPTALAFDPPGNLLIVDQFNHRLRRVDASGNIQTIAGNGTASYGGDNGPATSASFGFPGSVVYDAAGNLFIVDTTANRIRKVTNGTITTVAGTGSAGFGGDGGSPLQAMFNGAFGIAIDSAGNLYIGDTTNSRIRKISASAGGPGPTITSAGVTNAASFQTGIAPGAIVTIFGSNLGAPAGQILSATGTSWGPSVAGVSVTMDGISAPVYRVLNLNGQEQLSVQAPFSLFGRNSTSVIVTTSAGSSAPVSVPVMGAQPGIFVLGSANEGAVHADGSVVTAAKPAVAGETIVLYLTGMGPVNNQPNSGDPASFTTLSPTLVTPQITIGGLSAPAVFSGLTPGFIGLYQINTVIPAATASTTVDITVTANGVSSNTVKLPVH